MLMYKIMFNLVPLILQSVRIADLCTRAGSARNKMSGKGKKRECLMSQCSRD